MKKYSLVIIVLLLLGCRKSSNQVPNVLVDFYIYLTQPDYATLNSVGNWKYVTGGVKGIIIYHKTIDEFAAYDRSCPYDPHVDGAVVAVDSTNLFAVDATCGSKFQLLDGSVVAGPATTSLKAYRCDFDGVSILHIYN